MVGSALIPEESLIVGAARQLIEDRADVANVAAVVLTADGETFAGVNVGNDVGGICAEVAALARALAVSTSRPELVAATRLDGVVTPCGRCRQLMIDRFPDIAAVVCVDGRKLILTMDGRGVEVPGAPDMVIPRAGTSRNGH